MNKLYCWTSNLESFLYYLNFFHFNSFWKFHLPPVKMSKWKNTNKSKKNQVDNNTPQMILVIHNKKVYRCISVSVCQCVPWGPSAAGAPCWWSGEGVGFLENCVLKTHFSCKVQMLNTVQLQKLRAFHILFIFFIISIFDFFSPFTPRGVDFDF